MSAILNILGLGLFYMLCRLGGALLWLFMAVLAVIFWIIAVPATFIEGLIARRKDKHKWAELLSQSKQQEMT